MLDLAVWTEVVRISALIVSIPTSYVKDVRSDGSLSC